MNGISMFTRKLVLIYLLSQKLLLMTMKANMIGMNSMSQRIQAPKAMPC